MLCHLMNKWVLCKMGSYSHIHSEHHEAQTPYKSCENDTSRLGKDSNLKIKKKIRLALTKIYKLSTKNKYNNNNNNKITLKGLCHNGLVFFFNIANYASLFAFKHSVSKDTKSHRRVKQVCLPSVMSNVTNNKNKL